jgi:hypothetical protein
MVGAVEKVLNGVSDIMEKEREREEVIREVRKIKLEK